MTKSQLISNKEEYIKQVGEYFTSHRFRLEWIDYPDKYPCVVLYGIGYNFHTGRDYIDTEFIYLDDFQLYECYKCQRLIRDSEECHEDFEFNRICQQCAEINDYD